MPKKTKKSANKETVDEFEKMKQELVHLARLGLAARPQDVLLLVRRIARRNADSHPELTEELNKLLRDAPTRSSPLRKAGITQVPVDLDSRLQLLRVDPHPRPEVEPIYRDDVRRALEQVLQEHRSEAELQAEGLVPTRTMLFTGPPGVGKSLGAKWMAHEMGVPLLTLDLSAVISSYLGRTGTNVRAVLDYAKDVRCVLLLDEFDAIAKRRDDAIEVGELKRLVTVLLQEVDDWPSGGLLVAATNHASLLDPAIWRRFEVVIDFPMPEEDLVVKAVRDGLGGDLAKEESLVQVFATVFDGTSFSDISRELLRARRELALDAEASIDEILKRKVGEMNRRQRKRVALALVHAGRSQREANELTGVSRDTIRAALRKENENG